MRRGNVMVVVAVLCLVAFIGIGSMDYLTRADLSSSANLVRELRATYLAESIAAQIEARANRRPWDQRFWFRESLTARTIANDDHAIVFAKGSGHVHIAGDMPEGEYDYAGVVKDRDPGLKEYRIFLEVTLQGHKYVFSWDKRCDETLLGGLNRGGSRLDKQLDSMPDGTGNAADAILDDIKTAAEMTPAERLQGNLAQLLEKLRADEQVYQGATEVPLRPSGTPSPPPRPVLSPEPEPSPSGI
jgi:hypothetical protein